MPEWTIVDMSERDTNRLTMVIALHKSNVAIKYS